MRFNDFSKEGLFSDDGETYWWRFNVTAATKEQSTAATVLRCPKALLPLVNALQPDGIAAKPQQLIPDSVSEKTVNIKSYIAFLKISIRKLKSSSVRKTKKFLPSSNDSQRTAIPVLLLFAFGGYSYQTRVTRFYHTPQRQKLRRNSTHSGASCSKIYNK